MTMQRWNWDNISIQSLGDNKGSHRMRVDSNGGKEGRGRRADESDRKEDLKLGSPVGAVASPLGDIIHVVRKSFVDRKGYDEDDSSSDEEEVEEEAKPTKDFPSRLLMGAPAAVLSPTPDGSSSSDEEESSSDEESTSSEEDDDDGRQPASPMSRTNRATGPYNAEEDPNLEDKKMILELLQHGARCQVKKRCPHPSCLLAKSMIRHITKCGVAHDKCSISYCARAKFVLKNGPTIQAAINKKRAAAEKKESQTKDAVSSRAPKNTTGVQQTTTGSNKKALPGRRPNLSRKKKARPQWVPGKLANILEEDEEDWKSQHDKERQHSIDDDKEQRHSIKNALQSALDAFGLSDSDDSDDESIEASSSSEDEVESQDDGNKAPPTTIHQIRGGAPAKAPDPTPLPSSSTTAPKNTLTPVGAPSPPPDPSPLLSQQPPPAFIPAKTYQGSKPGYVFTTSKEKGLGYHLDEYTKLTTTTTTTTPLGSTAPATRIPVHPRSSGLSVLQRVEGSRLPAFLPAQTYQGFKPGYVFNTTAEHGLGYHLDVVQVEKWPVLQPVEGTNLAAFLSARTYQGFKPGYVFTTSYQHGVGYHLDAVQVKTWPRLLLQPPIPSGTGMSAAAFIPSTAYRGSKQGYVFTRSYENGLGYHLDAQHK